MAALGLKVPNFCTFVVLKITSVLIGVTLLGFALLYFISTLVWTIIYSNHVTSYDVPVSPDITYDLAKTIAMEYGSTIQILFSIILIYGSIKEISAFTASWLILQTAILINAFSVVAVHASFVHYIHILDLIFIVLIVGSMWTVYTFYRKLPKDNTTY